MLAIGLSQLMVVLDATVMNVALPSAQIDLNFSDALRPWVITAYALSFGGLLLLGGRIADHMGRKQVFLIGLVGFAAASARGGAAPTFAVLLAARVLQGRFTALLARAALSLLTTTFTDPKERGRAFGIYGAIKLDVPGAMFATLGFFALVFGFTNAEGSGFGSIGTWGFLAVGVVLLAIFVLLQRKGNSPLLPLRIVVHRDRGASMIAIFAAGAVIFGLNLYLVYYLQIVLGFTPLQTGVAVLPLCAGISGSAVVSTAVLMPRLGAKVLVPTGMLLSAAGSVLLMLAKADSSYALHLALARTTRGRRRLP